MRKVFGKMGISTLHSYKGAQIFEAVGLAPEVVDRCFDGTASRIRGVGFDVLAAEALRRHALGFPGSMSGTGSDLSRGAPTARVEATMLENPGEFHWRAGAEKHMWCPESIAFLQQAARRNDAQAYGRFADLVNGAALRRCTLRGLLELTNGSPVPIETVEPFEGMMDNARRIGSSEVSLTRDDLPQHLEVWILDHA
jgi:glutamate synthase (NADPH/NADH) large chain